MPKTPEQSRSYYLANREEILAKRRTRRAEANEVSNHRRHTKTKFVVGYKELLGCMDCKRDDLPGYALDLDHVRGSKSMNLARLVGSDASWDLIVEEIAKCDVVCATCHRIRTHNRK